MTHETKQILTRSINVFLSSSEKDKAEMVSVVQNNLKTHYNALKTIGMGYDTNMVQAGEIFLRIFNKK